MLRIKDNVDLKELEKFGLESMVFENGDFLRKYKWVYTDKKCLYSTNEEDMIDELDIMEDREIRSSFNVDLLYDLIEAGLVEKVRE